MENNKQLYIIKNQRNQKQKMKMIENLDSNESDRTKYNEKTAKAH